MTRLLDLIQFPDIAGRHSTQLSGGQRQRVALARALDAKVRKELRQGLRGIHDEAGLTTVFVTHGQDKAMELADLVVVMPMGRIEQTGRRQDIRTRPRPNSCATSSAPDVSPATAPVPPPLRHR